MNDPVRKVVEYRLLTADSASALAEYLTFLMRHGWRTYGGVKFTDKNPEQIGNGEMVWMQAMVVYEGDRYEEFDSLIQLLPH